MNEIRLLMMPIHNLNRNMYEALEEGKETIILADQLGFFQLKKD